MNIELKTKKLLLALQTKLLLKQKSQIIRYNVGFQQAHSLGILYNYENQGKNNIVQRFIRNLKNEGKKTSVLCYTTDEVINYNVSLLFSFTQKSICFFGKINNDRVLNFINTSFDYLFHVDITSNALLNYIIAKSQAKCRIGNFDPKRAELFEIMVKFVHKEGTDDIEGLTEQMFHYVNLLDRK